MYCKGFNFLIEGAALAQGFNTIDLKGYSALLIDIDDTLYSYQSCHKKALAEVYRYFVNQFGERLSFSEFKSAYRAKRDKVTKRLYPSGVCRSRFFAFQELFEELEIVRSYYQAQKFENVYWRAIISVMTLDAAAEKLINHAKTMNMVICAVSDMEASVQVSKLEKLGLIDKIDFLVTSEEVGAEKPNSIIFTKALEKLKLSPAEVVMVGDSDEKDRVGAEKVGIKAYRVSL